MSGCFVKTFKDGSVTSLLLSRPERLNALSPLLMEELLSALQAAESDRECRCILLGGEGRGFSSGADLSEFDFNEGIDIGAALHSFYHPVVRLIRSMNKPVVTAINGVAAGAGCNIGLAGDIVVAGRSSRFIQSFVNIGLVPDAAGTWTIPRLIGRARALRWMMTGEEIDAETALDWGLISYLFDDDVLQSEAHKIAQHLAALPVRSLAMVKKLVDQSTEQGIEAQMHSEAVIQSQLGKSTDCFEGISAFLERRRPSFTGQL